MIRAVIFDVDGTLLDSERIYMEAWRQAGAQLGYPVAQEALIKTRAVNRAVAMQVFREYCGEDFPYEAVRAERVRLAEEMIKSTAPQRLVKPGTEKTLAWLKEHGYAMAVASSTDQAKTEAHLKHTDLLKWFPVAIGGDRVKRSKPEPDIFLLAAEQLGVKAEECLVVGDTPADVLAGTAANMKVALIPDCVPVNEQTGALSWRILSSIEELPGLLT